MGAVEEAAEEEAEKKAITGEARKRYVGGALRRAHYLKLGTHEYRPKEARQPGDELSETNREVVRRNKEAREKEEARRAKDREIEARKTREAQEKERKAKEEKRKDKAASAWYERRKQTIKNFWQGAMTPEKQKLLENERKYRKETEEREENEREEQTSQREGGATFVKEYTIPSSGNRFMQFEAANGRKYDIKVREGRNGSILYSRKEARALAEEKARKDA